MADNRRTGMVVAPAVAGLIGAGIGMLFAPRSGRETRKLLKIRKDEMKNRAKQKADLAGSKARSVASVAKQTGRDVKDDLKEGAKQVNKQRR